MVVSQAGQQQMRRSWQLQVAAGSGILEPLTPLLMNNKITERTILPLMTPHGLYWLRNPDVPHFTHHKNVQHLDWQPTLTSKNLSNSYLSCFVANSACMYPEEGVAEERSSRGALFFRAVPVEISSFSMFTSLRCYEVDAKSLYIFFAKPSDREGQILTYFTPPASSRLRVAKVQNRRWKR